MKETALTRAHSLAVSRGWVAPTASRSFSWVEDMTNSSGTGISRGDVVVVVADGSIELADTENDPRPTGVALDDIDDDDTGQVCFGGPVDLVSVGASVTGGQYGQTSTTPGQVQVTSSWARAFLVFTSSGTTPTAFLWGGRGGGGIVAPGGIPDIPCDHGNMGATETIDVSTCTWNRGTLDADCTITVSGFTVDEALVVVCEFTEDGTGGWGITWDPDVLFVGDDQPDTTAGAVTFFLLWSSAGDSTVYGARVGAGLTASSFATPAIVLGTAAAAGSADTVIRSDATIVAFDATAPVTQAFGDAAATGSAAVAARRDHKHGMPAAAGIGPLVLASDHGTPIVFDDIVQASDGSDFIYASEP